MYRDSLGNSYSSIANRKRGAPHTAKASSGGTRKFGRCCKDPSDTWQAKVVWRERLHRKWGHRF